MLAFVCEIPHEQYSKAPLVSYSVCQENGLWLAYGARNGEKSSTFVLEMEMWKRRRVPPSGYSASPEELFFTAPFRALSVSIVVNGKCMSMQCQFSRSFPLQVR
jgi:hypothetical protein